MGKEGNLVSGEIFDDGLGISLGGGEELLVTLEKPLQVYEIGIVGFVEFGWRYGVEIHSCLLGRTEPSKLLPVNRV